ncbi:MAG: hypothetical protein LUP01_01990 [Methanothrix sp.]|nr:hypothetical protein [Methanothrix sp.]
MDVKDVIKEKTKCLKQAKAKSDRRRGNELEIDIGYPYLILDGVCRSIGSEKWRRDEARRGCIREAI